MRRIYLIDCPGIVPPSSRDDEASKVLKGVVRVEHLSSPTDHIPALLSRIRPEYMERTYGVVGWSDTEDFLTKLARKSGKLLKGGEPDLRTVATVVLNDWIRGKIPYFVAPPTQIPGMKSSTTKSTEIVEPVTDSKTVTDGETQIDKTGVVKGVSQPLHQIVRSNKFLEEDEVGEFEHADEAVPQEGERVENDLGDVDSEEEDDEWSGIGSDDDDDDELDTELCFEDLVAHASKAPGSTAAPSSLSHEKMNETFDSARGSADAGQAEPVHSEIDSQTGTETSEEDEVELSSAAQKAEPNQEGLSNAKGKRKCK